MNAHVLPLAPPDTIRWIQCRGGQNNFRYPSWILCGIHATFLVNFTLTWACRASIFVVPFRMFLPRDWSVDNRPRLFMLSSPSGFMIGHTHARLTVWGLCTKTTFIGRFCWGCDYLFFWGLWSYNISKNRAEIKYYSVDRVDVAQEMVKCAEWAVGYHVLSKSPGSGMLVKLHRR